MYKPCADYIYNDFNRYLDMVKKHDNMLDQTYIDHIYSKKRNASERHLFNYKWKHRFLHIISRYIYIISHKISPGDKIVDFGGGTGIISNYLAVKYDVNVVNLEIDSKSRYVCESRARFFNADVDSSHELSSIDNYTAISFFSLREAYLGGADINRLFTNAAQLYFIDRNDRYLLRVFSEKYGLTACELSKIITDAGLFKVSEFGACIMNKSLSFFEPKVYINYPLWLSPIYMGCYSKSL